MPAGLFTYYVVFEYRKKDVKRVDKWMKFIQSDGFDSFYKGRPNEELIRRVFKGIPPRIRPRVWPILLNVASAKRDRVYEVSRLAAATANSTAACLSWRISSYSGEESFEPAVGEICRTGQQMMTNCALCVY
ncbi:unnamed protein product [Hydatigera taeniaeformis]|uniref:Rab-GAP TBC domain-containing protein n=1 Tax=Hydatigena taeniaeformis TaxID=6205 RepID=A0A0R3X4V4_HYDTA|nr:unnamed protein product [Hydatigera taeniaeformis]